MSKRKSAYSILPEIPYGIKPRVLLVGNGLNLSFDGAADTDTIIQTEWKNYYGTELPNRNNSLIKHELWNLPFPLQVVAATKDHVQGCMTELSSLFKYSAVSLEQKGFIRNIISTKFDAILSTNYSLEIEKSIIDEFSIGKAYRHYRTTKEQTSQQRTLGIFQCTELPDENHTLLWHIHGTALRKLSMVMGQFYYGKLLAEITARADAVNTRYRIANKEKSPFKPESWVDYFLIGDVFIFGFQLDYSESDIWWLLSYKKDAFPESKAYFYSPDIDAKKQLLLDCYMVNTPAIEIKNKDYIQYYKKICEEISNHDQ